MASAAVPDCIRATLFLSAEFRLSRFFQQRISAGSTLQLVDHTQRKGSRTGFYRAGTASAIALVSQALDCPAAYKKDKR